MSADSGLHIPAGHNVLESVLALARSGFSSMSRREPDHLTSAQQTLDSKQLRWRPNTIQLNPARPPMTSQFFTTFHSF